MLVFWDVLNSNFGRDSGSPSDLRQMGTCGSVVVEALKLQAGRSRDRVPMRWIFSNLPNPSGRTMALGSTQPLIEMSTRNLNKETWG
jgi:hypothetical protein